ncbi:hypothetical protein G6F37_002192 [Rhizopus arrhizus]|nr:hypothetical protein G6F38_002036 [Rhizopus arrhizus]KAG1162395.1 hypothetical protein G6F37_002192 [Rhizopus arrhizus]
MNVAVPLSADAPFSPIYDEQLQQGSLYIIKVKQVSLALFEGSEVEPMRWSETRQLPGDFDIYNAFDEYGNPPVHLWSRYLKTSLPTNWFYMFEEARRKQRMWFKQRDDYIQHNPIPEICQGADNPSFSNTDVSSMLLSPQGSNASLAIASTNIIDPSISNENTSSMSAHTSMDDGTETTNEGRYAISPKSTSLVIDREQIRRHLAPGQATALNRQSMSTYTKSSSPLSNTFHNATEENRFTVQQYSSQLDFPHDSDQFSIRSDLPSSPSLPVPTKTHSRPSIKNTAWG